MKYYATLLNLKHANEHSLEGRDLFCPHLQHEVLRKMIWGSGKTEQESMRNAIDNLISDCVLETYECQDDAKNIVKNNSGKDALRHLWIHYDEYHDEPTLFPVPCHDTLVEFCDRYKLPEQAKQELARFFDVILHMGQ